MRGNAALNSRLQGGVKVRAKGLRGGDDGITLELQRIGIGVGRKRAAGNEQLQSARKEAERS
jgi:hypothetical protein